MGADLRTQAEGEAALGRRVQIMAHVRERHGRAGKGHGDASGQINILGGLRRQQQRQEGIMGGLDRFQAIIAHFLQFRRVSTRLVQIRSQYRIYFHGLAPPLNDFAMLVAISIALIRRRRHSPGTTILSNARRPHTSAGSSTTQVTGMMLRSRAAMLAA